MEGDQKIIVTNSAIIIKDYTWGDSDKLEKSFSTYDPITHKLNLFMAYYDAENKRFYLPVGIDLWYVQKELNEKGFTRVTEHDCEDTGLIQMKFKPRNDRQWEALQFLLGVGMYEKNQYVHISSLNLSTGIGKTYLSIATLSARRLKTFIITSSSTLLNQWKKEILKFTDLKESDILFISGSNMIDMILADRSKKAREAKIYLCTHKSINEYCSQNGWDKLYNLFYALRIGVKIIDEFHYNVENGWMINYFTNVKYTYLVTATPGRSSWKEDRIYQLSTKNIPCIDLFDEESDPHTDYMAIKFNSNPSAGIISGCKNKYGLDRMKYINWVTGNIHLEGNETQFYKMSHIIMELVLDVILRQHGKVLIYIGTNKGILRFYKWLGYYYPELIGDIGIFTSLLPNEEKIKEREKKLLLSTLKSAGLGEDIKGLKLTIVLAEPFKSEIQARQSLGRTRDPNTTYLELVDVGFTQIRRFYNYKLPIMNKYALSVTDDSMSSYEIDRRYQNIMKNRPDITKSPISLCDKRFDFSDIDFPEEPNAEE